MTSLRLIVQMRCGRGTVPSLLSAALFGLSPWWYSVLLILLTLSQGCSSFASDWGYVWWWVALNMRGALVFNCLIAIGKESTSLRSDALGGLGPWAWSHAIISLVNLLCLIKVIIIVVMVVSIRQAVLSLLLTRYHIGSGGMWGSVRVRIEVLNHRWLRMIRMMLRGWCRWHSRGYTLVNGFESLLTFTRLLVLKHNLRRGNFESNAPEPVWFSSPEVFNVSFFIEARPALVPLLELVINNGCVFGPIVCTFIPLIIVMLVTAVLMMVKLVRGGIIRRTHSCCTVALSSRNVGVLGGGGRDTLGVISLIWMEVDLLGTRVDFVIRYDLSYHFSNIWLVGQSLEDISDAG